MTSPYETTPTKLTITHAGHQARFPRRLKPPAPSGRTDGVDPLILRQAYPVRQAPYGLAGSGALAWVSQTASNIVIGYDLSTGIPVEKVRYPTVRQPNSLAFDEASDTLYVVSGSGAGVQVIEHAAGIR